MQPKSQGVLESVLALRRFGDGDDAQFSGGLIVEGPDAEFVRFRDGPVFGDAHFFEPL